jgi:hypothetical protein
MLRFLEPGERTSESFRKMSDLLISRVPLGSDRLGFLVYDLSERRIISEISDYADVLQFTRQNSLLTVEQGLNHLVEFWRHLVAKNVRLGGVSDVVVEEFRDANYAKVLAAASHRGNPNAAKATVNLKLYRIYDWLVWLQKSRRLPVGTIGHHGLVTAIIDAQKAARPRGRSGWTQRQRKYPLLFKIQNANAKHNAAAAVVTESHVEELAKRLMAPQDSFVSQRNMLFADVADTAGFRRGSICSLDVRQFELDAIERAEGEFLVTPYRQKFGYMNTFGISIALAYRIRQFIDDYWQVWVRGRNLASSVHNHKLFLSRNTGRPITERAMTQIISAGFRAIGFDKGVGAHALRGKFTSEACDDELAERMELGLDTSNWSIAAAIAPKLGHSDPSQYYRYASSSQARQARIARDGRIAELKRLRVENADLKRERDALKSELAASGAARHGRSRRV